VCKPPHVFSYDGQYVYYIRRRRRRSLIFDRADVCWGGKRKKCARFFFIIFIVFVSCSSVATSAAPHLGQRNNNVAVRHDRMSLLFSYNVIHDDDNNGVSRARRPVYRRDGSNGRMPFMRARRTDPLRQRFAGTSRDET